MSTEALPTGSEIVLAQSGRRGRIETFLGAGGQGEVYRARFGEHLLAFKIYHPSVVAQDTRLVMRLGRAIGAGAPDERFLWPLDFATALARPDRTAIVMPLREPRFRSMRDLIAAPPKRIAPRLAERCLASLRIADSFLKLHARGLCYQDINFGNLFLDPQSGDIAICDNDNVDVNGAPASVWGTRKFMAPEVVRRETLPSAQTDLYSMAVLFFYVFFAWHPLDGRREAEIMILDGEAETALYGTEPRFLFDPLDLSNGPVPGMHDPIVRRWKALSPALRALFVRAFTLGLSPRPGARVVETEWREAFARLRYSLVSCPACGMEHSPGADDADPDPARLLCVACGIEVPLPLGLLVGRDEIALVPGAEVTAHHLDPARRFDDATVLAAVEPHPSDPTVLGLRNRGGTGWRATFADGRGAEIAPGRTLRLMPGVTVDFGRRAGVVGILGNAGGMR
jgi:DNA-binding helix-hairpin-helix protein with protein kinase domain